MAQCEVCGNVYDKTLEVSRGGETHTHCGVRIVGHGIEADGAMYCRAHCAERSGVEGARDRVDA